MDVRFKSLSATARCPEYATDGSAGMDLYADESTNILIGCRKLIQTNIAIALPQGFEGQIRPRSGLALKKGITVLNAPGTIDSDYRGSIGVILFNAGNDIFHVEMGDRIAQLVIARYERANLIEVSDLDDTERNNGGFGSTGSR